MDLLQESLGGACPPERFGQAEQGPTVRVQSLQPSLNLTDEGGMDVCPASQLDLGPALGFAELRQKNHETSSLRLGPRPTK